MTVFIAFAGGLLTIVSPCILPVLPFVFARADRPFRRSGLPLLIGMVLTFAVVGSFATVAGEWVVRANQAGRVVAMLLFALFGAALLFPALADWLTRPFVRLGGAVQPRGDRAGQSIGGSLLLGASTGLLWTPCAGPILGLILTGAAVQGNRSGSAALLLAFAAGAAVALALTLLAGNRVLGFLKRSLGAETWIRRGLGVAVLVGVVSVALGWDTGVLTRLSLTGSANGLEQRLVDRIRPPDTTKAESTAPPDAPPMMMMRSSRSDPSAGLDLMPPLDGAIAWLNGPPLTREGLRGHVVLVDFWTYSCINCLRALPYVQAWAAKYRHAGLTVIGVHTPEFAFERDRSNVAKAVKDLGITYPVAVDSDRTIWTAFGNEYWPAHYFIDGRGRIRSHHFGEGSYEESERQIQALLAERETGAATTDLAHVSGSGVQAAPNLTAMRSPETYLGYEREEHFASPEGIAKDQIEHYSAPPRPQLNQWGLDGRWTIAGESASLPQAPGIIVFRFHARDLHLVLGASHGKPVRFRVALDGAPPLDDAGVDVDGQGHGTITGHRLYQLIRQKGAVEDRTFQIEFLDGNVQAFSFTFG